MNVLLKIPAAVLAALPAVLPAVVAGSTLMLVNYGDDNVADCQVDFVRKN